MTMLKGLMMAMVVGGFGFVTSSEQLAQAASSPLHSLPSRFQSTQLQSPAQVAAVAPAAQPASEVRPAVTQPAPYVQPGEPPANLRRLKAIEVPVPLRAKLHKLLQDHGNEPIGSLVPTEFEGRRYIARLEIHYHPEGGPVRPWGNHRGVSLFVEQ
jgi:hypothetical protein